MSGPSLLAVTGLAVRYGVINAVRGVDLHVDSGEALAIVGPNGAGKTSLLSAVAGIVPAAGGAIALAGEALSGVTPEDIVRRGIALVPEGRHIFATLTVLENMQLGATIRKDAAAVAEDIERAFVTFPILGERRRQPAGLLSGGEQQQLAIARALLSRPRLLMLDEPSLGLAPAIVDQVYAVIAAIKADGVGILLVEQNATRAFSVADRVAVMSGGRFALEGTPAGLARDEQFDAAYFGTSMGVQAASR